MDFSQIDFHRLNDDDMKSPPKQLCKRNKSNNTVPLVRIDSDDVHQTHSHYHQMNHHIEHTTDVKYMYRNKTRGYLIRIDKEGAHKTIFALKKQITTVGRRKSNDIQLKHAIISTKHARVKIDNHIAVVIDLNSTNGTRIGNELPAKAPLNKKIMPNKECVIQSGHYVSFGDCHFVFYHEHDYGEYQMAIDHLCNRINVSFPQYPQFGSKFYTICEEESYDDLNVLLEDISDGFDESVILEAISEEIDIKDE
eukprot:994138_1